MKHSLPDLPYAYDALEPFIDAKTMEIHHTKHHQTYIDKLNAALKNETALSDLPLKKLMGNLETIPAEIQTAVRNHGGGHANHSFFWPLLKKNVEAAGPAVDAISAHFGSYEAFKESFSTSGALLFGSGWVWLVQDKDSLEIITTPNQDSPISLGKKPLLGLDVWEHAYYLKYQNRRPEYIEAFFQIINWERVNSHYLSAL